MAAPTDDDLRACLEALRAAGGNKAQAARAMKLSASTFKDRLAQAEAREADGWGAAGPKDRLGRIAALLEKSGIDINEVGRIEQVKLSEWEGLSKDADGNAVVTPLTAASLVLTPSWADGPEWPVIRQAPPVTIKPMRATTTPRPDDWRTCVVWPDIQAGFYFRDGEMEATHDEKALAVALEITHDADPDLVVMVGDNLDLPELSKYRKHPAFQRTTQASIDRAARLCASIRARVRPECKIIWLAGNHEERLPNYIIDNAVAAFGLKRANSPKSWPVLSVPHLCRFDEYDVTFLPGYPANVYWINDSLSVIHGTKVRSGGSSAHAYLPEIRHSVIFGHVHRHERAAVTRLTKAGPRTYHAACFGALCRIDGSVPGAASGYDLDGHPIATTENWQQGMGIVEYQPGDGDFAMEAVEIWNGRARWQGRSYAAPADLVEAT
jgi:hypothetical protein